MNRHAKTAIAALGLTAALASMPASSASAGEFTISACQADRGGFSTSAFSDFATRGMQWKRACNPEGTGLRGLVTANVVRSGRIQRGARSVFVLDAPPGTAISRFTWSGHARRRDCRFALQVYAERPGAGAIPIKNVPANRNCPKPTRAQGAGWPKPRTYDVGGATRIVQRIICVGSNDRRFCSARGSNYIRTFTAQATVIDNSGPAVSIVADNPFTQGHWVRGAQTVTYDASDNTGVRSARPVVGTRHPLGRNHACDFTQPVPCSNGPGQITIGPSELDEGTQTLAVIAEDAGGNASTSPPTTVRVDNTAPGAVAVALEGGDGWRNVNDFDLGWINQPESDRAPIARAYFRLCPVSGGECRPGETAAPEISRIGDFGVPAAGEWDLRIWRADAAGNHEPQNASVPVRLRFDPEPPSLGFEQPAADEPTSLSVAVEDRVSGLAAGTIEISQQGSGSWQTLATSQEGTRLVTRVDDSNLPPGPYALRATARDHAGNLNSTDRRTNGQPMIVTLPLRAETVIDAGATTTKRVRRTIGRRGHRRKVWRKVPIVQPDALAAFGEEVPITGTLTTRDGRPLASVPIAVLAHDASGVEQQVTTVTTDAQGRFAHTAQATSTQTLRFVHPGSATLLPAQDTVELRTKGSSSLAVNKRRTVNGKSVVFRGQVQGLPLPAAGKLVELQVLLSKGWQTFRTPRTDPAGKWQQPYRFQNTCGIERFRFRARVPEEAGYPFETGASRTVKVRVRGRPCPS
ncbi:MAG TPA: hypothetical protein VFK56_19450 [Mycobacterium sp.]|nr:hypothetical protein [Mycobacterium sp.]